MLKLWQLILAIALVVTSCGLINTTNQHRHMAHGPIMMPDAEGNLRFASLKDFEEYSLLKDFDFFQKLKRKKKTVIKFPVCFETSEKITRKEKKLLKRLVSESFNLWISALDGYDNWKIRKIQVAASFKTKCSPRTLTDRKYIVVYNKGSQGRSYAEYFNYKAVIEKTLSYNAMSRGLMLHEVGHQLGLGDTYSEDGYQNPIGQDKSIMNIYWEVSPDKLTEDDRAGIRKVWSSLQGVIKAEDCPAGYIEGTTLEGKSSRSFFCVKSSQDSALTDENVQCPQWAATGECANNPGYMLNSCSKSCFEVLNAASGDKHPSCATWAELGECKKNPEYMLKSCAASCASLSGDNVNSEESSDDNNGCPSWAAAGECSSNPGYMLKSCKKSCGALSNPNAVDLNKDCQQWASLGECRKNPNYMIFSCSKSCAKFY